MESEILKHSKNFTSTLLSKLKWRLLQQCSPTLIHTKETFSSSTMAHTVCWTSTTRTLGHESGIWSTFGTVCWLNRFFGNFFKSLIMNRKIKIIGWGIILLLMWTSLMLETLSQLHVNYFLKLFLWKKFSWWNFQRVYLPLALAYSTNSCFLQCFKRVWAINFWHWRPFPFRNGRCSQRSKFS